MTQLHLHPSSRCKWVMVKFCSLNVSKVNKKSSLRKEKMIIEVFQMTGSSSHLSFNILFLVMIFNYFKGSFSRTCYLTIIRQLMMIWSFLMVKTCYQYEHIDYQFSSVTQSCLTLCDPMDCSMPGLPLHHQLPEFTQTHVHRVGEAIRHLILCRPLLLLPQSLPAPGSFQMSQFFTSGGQSIGVAASTSVLPMNIQDWFPLGWTGWISSLTPQFKSINSLALSFLYGPTLTSIHDNWKMKSFE